MPKGILFWVLMILWLLFGLWTYWPAPGAGWSPAGGHLLLWVLLGLLGWQVFGKPVQ
jgi:hypothetical protein